MGFDLYGKKPVNAEPEPEWDINDKESLTRYWEWQQNTPGAYFRNNVWWWHPLWDYVCNVCSDIVSESDYQDGHSNSGRFISNRKCQKIYARLIHLLDQGEVKKYEKDYMKSLTVLKDEVCNICEGTGERVWPEGVKVCNKCDGKGLVRPFETNYPFSEENVRDFAVFCKNCGGFSIC